MYVSGPARSDSGNVLLPGRRECVRDAPVARREQGCSPDQVEYRQQEREKERETKYRKREITGKVSSRGRKREKGRERERENETDIPTVTRIDCETERWREGEREKGRGGRGRERERERERGGARERETDAAEALRDDGRGGWPGAKRPCKAGARGFVRQTRLALCVPLSGHRRATSRTREALSA
jgi:hypothetical protein